MKNDKHKSKVIASKIDGDISPYFEKILERKGINKYQLLQHCIEAFVRLTMEPEPLSEELMQTMTEFFWEVQCWNSSSFNLADPATRMEVTDALLFVGDREKPEGSDRALVMVHDPFGGTSKEDWNKQHIIEFILSHEMKPQYKALRRLGVELGTNSIYETLCKIIEVADLNNTDEKEILEWFHDNDYSDFGKKPHEGEPYVRHHHKSVEMYERDMFDFTDDKHPFNDNGS